MRFQVEFVNVPDEAARAGLLAASMLDWFAKNFVVVFAMLRQGAAQQRTDTVERLIGRQSRGFAEFARDHAQFFEGRLKRRPPIGVLLGESSSPIH